MILGVTVGRIVVMVGVAVLLPRDGKDGVGLVEQPENSMARSNICANFFMFISGL
jgi:uncharacterized membrane protein